MALAQLLFLARQTQTRIHQDATVFTDSQSELKAMNGFQIQSGQFLTKNIIGKVQKLNKNGIACRIQWSPGHKRITGNIEANRFAQLAMRPEALSSTLRNPIMLYSILKQRANTLVTGPDPKISFSKAKVGRFIKFFDKALLEKHTKIINNRRNRKQSQILCQFRKRICRLNSDLPKIHAVDSDMPMQPQKRDGRSFSIPLPTLVLSPPGT